jgi:hypothetical protein
MSTAVYEVQRSIYEALITSAEVTQLVQPSPSGGPGIYDSVPENVAYPYIKIGGGDTETDIPSTFKAKGRENTVSVHIWSRYVGMAEVKRIARAVAERLAPIDQLAQLPLETAPWQWNGTSYIFGEFMDDPDGITRHGILRFRVRVSRAS